MLIVIRVVLIGLIPAQTSKCHENVSPTAVCIMIGDTFATCYRGNNSRDANMVNSNAKGQVSHECVADCCAHIMMCDTLRT